MRSKGSLRGTASATLEQAQAWSRQRRAARLPELDAYFAEIWRLGSSVGYDPAVVVAQSSLETEGWTLPAWRERLNPAGIGISADFDRGISFRDGVDAARAHLVHLSSFVKGYDPRLRSFIHLDPTWQSVFEAGHAGTASVVEDLTGRWSNDICYGRHILDHYDALRDSIQVPGEQPPPSPGRAPAPTGIDYVRTGNWNERAFEQHPLGIVFHISGEEDVDQTIACYQNPISRISVHALVARSGRIHLIVDPSRAAWSNNDVKNPRRDVEWLNQSIAKSADRGGPMSLNDFTLAIEFVGAPQTQPTEEQYRSIIELSAYWRDRFGIQPNRGRFLRHSDINSVDRLYCPGPRFDLARVIEALGGSPDDLSG